MPVQFDPVKRQRRVRIGLELLPFFTLVVGEKDESILVESFYQHNPHGRSGVATSRCETHRVDIANARFDRGSEPISKLLDRIGIEIASAQTFAGVFVE